MRNELAPRSAVETAIDIWANARTSPDSLRRSELVAHKRTTLLGFLSYVELHPLKVRPADVLCWQQELEARGLARSTVYAKLSHVSSFYAWLGARLGRDYNPVEAVRPKAPRPYNSETVKALSKRQVSRLLNVVWHKADAGDVIAKRDYALLLFYFNTGLRRSEVMRLRWRDIQMTEEGDAIRTRVKGGEIETIEVPDQRVWRALFDYLETADRLGNIKDDDPLWARHDPAASGLHDPLSSHGFVKNLKTYAQEAGVVGMHLHRTRHTVAKDTEERGGLAAAQEKLGHKDMATTRIYTGKLSKRRNRYGSDFLDDVL